MTHHKLSGRRLLGGAVLSALLAGVVPAAGQDADDSSWTGIPIIGFSPETNLLFGALVLYQFDVGRNAQPRVDAKTPAARKSSVNAIAVYTLRNQLAFALQPSLYLNGETWRVFGSLEGSLFPDQLYAPGQDSPDDFEDFDQRIFAASAGAERGIYGPLRIGAGMHFAYAQVTETEDGGLLAQGAIAGSQGGIVVGPAPTLAWDDRDKDTATSSGGRHELKVAFSLKALGADFAFTQATIQSRQFFSLGHEQVLALEFFSVLTAGTVPFQLMARLGGENRMRGYYAGRYRDLNQVAVQVEYRAPLFWRMGAVAFAGAGNVTRRLSDFDLADPKVSGGLGLRLALSREERVNLRVDYALTREGGGNLYVGLVEAF